MNAQQLHLKNTYGVTRENVTIADVLFIAANEYLWDGTWANEDSEKDIYSCLAVRQTVIDILGVIESAPLFARTIKGLKALGLDAESCSLYDDIRHKYGWEATQQFRYTWLMFAHEIALDQGV